MQLQNAFKWDLQREAQERVIFFKLIHLTAGVYLWEYALSVPFDISFITRRRKLTVSTGIYLLNRYIYLAAVICLLYVANLATTKEINCSVIVDFIQLAGNMSVGLASITFALRTAAIWSGNRYIVTLLILLVLGQWSLILQAGQLHSIWVAGQGCVNLQTKDKVLLATYIYSTCLDTVVMALSGWKLVVYSRVIPNSRFINILFRDGLVYYAFVLLGNIIIMVFEILNIDPLFNVMFNPSSIGLLTIAATRAVRNLQEVAISGGGVTLTTTNSGQLTTQHNMVRIESNEHLVDSSPPFHHIPRDQVHS